MGQTQLLARTFFTRFFESDLMPPGLPQVQLVIGSLVVLAAPGLLLPMQFAAKYVLLSRHPEVLVQVLLVDRLLFITLAMTALGFVALVIWEGVFPDRRDARILGSLPVAGRTQIGARLLALAALAGVFAAGVNAVPTVFYGSLIAGYGGASDPLRGAFAHLVATTFAGAFVFFTLIALQGALLNLAGRRTAERLSVVLQVLFVVALLQMIFFLPRMGSLFRTDLRDATSNPLVAAIPSVWFLGLYDVLGGRPSSGSASLAGVAILATALAVGAATALLMLTHARLMRLALETRETGGRGARALARTLGRLAPVRRRGVQRAICEFTLRTLLRSRTHRMLMAMYVGIAVALVVSALLPLLLLQGLAALARPDAAVLSGPLVLAFLTLAGMRVVLAIPVEPKANWVFRLREPRDRKAATDGVRDALLIAGGLPVIALATASALVLWGSWPALVHMSVCAAMIWLLAEILLLRLDALPFASTYFPGRGRLRTRWPIYLTAFTTYCYSTARLEVRLLEHSAAVAGFVGAIGLGALAIRFVRLRQVAGLTGFRFEGEDPEAMFQGFQLSEGLAAQPAQRLASD